MRSSRFWPESSRIATGPTSGGASIRDRAAVPASRGTARYYTNQQTRVTSILAELRYRKAVAEATVSDAAGNTADVSAN